MAMMILTVLAVVLTATLAAAAPLAAWVEITGRGAEVRAVVDGQTCPMLRVDGHTRAMRLRAGPDEAFANRICRAPAPRGAAHASIAGAALALPKPRPNRLVILGDSGCRLKGPAIQDCSDPAAGWPFARVAKLAAARKPDLVIHVGDYYYRETPCPAGDARCVGSPYGDRWPTWKAELFDPAAPLLAAAPWVFARGNHEDCNRGGRGWFRLLDGDTKVRACPAQSDTFLAPLGGVSLGVVDSADLDDVRLQPDQVAAFGRNLEPLLAAKEPVWLVTHRPVWEVGAKDGALTDAHGNINEQAAARAGGLGPVTLVIAGHQHTFFSLDFGPDHAAELVVGTGGDSLDSDKGPAPVSADLAIDGATARAFAMDRFGYFVFDRKGDGWVGAFHDLSDAVIARCTLRAGRLACHAA